MITHAGGEFEVSLDPLAVDERAKDTAIARMLIDKQYRGDLEATARGEMLTATTGVDGSAGYVAIELVSGTLHGRNGTFLLQHNGVMTRNTPELTIRVVPDSGTDELFGLSGRMTIDIVDGKHSYDFAYTFGETP